MNSKILLVILFIGAAIELANCQKKVICYHTNWSQYRSGLGQFYPENIDPFLCTHIIYAFAKITNNELTPYEWNDLSTPWMKGMYERTMALRTNNTNLKILLAVGGWTHGSGPFSTMANNPTSRTRFVAQAVDYITTNKFDGLDLDWEYPGSRDGSSPTDKQAFTALVKDLSAAFKPKGLLLTAAVGAGKSTIDAGYEIDIISQYLDFINLMSYDFHGGWESFTGHNAPLYKRSTETGDQALLNVDWAVQYWIGKGVQRDKLILGMGTYGHSFKLVNSNQNGFGAPTASNPTAGTYTNEAGFLSYYEVCTRLNSGWTEVWNEESKVPYAYSSSEWVGYDNTRSLRIKVDYLKANNLGGAMFWALDLDDFNGKFCNAGKYPLINFVKSYMNSGNETTMSSVASSTTTKKITTSTVTPVKSTISTTRNSILTTITTTKRQVTTTTTKPTTKTTVKQTTTFSTRKTSLTTTKSSTTTTKSTSSIKPSITSQQRTSTSSNLCYKGDGFYADKSSNCEKYYQCYNSGSSIAYFTCPTGTIFDQILQVCNWKTQATC